MRMTNTNLEKLEFCDWVGWEEKKELRENLNT